MELKAIKEYKSPEYPTTEESKNKILMMMARSGKISLGVAVMCLLCNCSFAYSASSIIAGLEPVGDIGGIIEVESSIYLFVKTTCIIGIIISVLVTIFFSIKSTKEYKNCEDVKKEKLRKNRNETIINCIVNICIFYLFIVISNIVEGFIGKGVWGLLCQVCILGIIVSLLFTMFFLEKRHYEYKECEDIEEKKMLRKKRNKSLIIGSEIITIFILIIIILELIRYLTFNRIIY